MSFLRQIIEDAAAGAISAGDISGTRGCLFQKPIARTFNKKTAPKFTILKFNAKVPKRKTESMLYQVINKLISEEEFNSLDVISKLQYAEKNVDRDKTATIFGLESEGGTVKVYVPHEEAKAFEEELQKELKGDVKREVAEILFELRNKFTIMHVDWPAVPEDEEVDMKLQGDAGTGTPGDAPAGGVAPPAGGDMDGVDMPSEAGDGKEEKPEDADISPPEDDTSSIKSMLDKVIDMLKTDAEARTAESNAKAKEAEAKEAEAAVKIADIKVRSEEEVLDAEQYFKKQNDNKKEAQKLTKLATFRQAMSQQRATDSMHHGKFE